MCFQCVCFLGAFLLFRKEEKPNILKLEYPFKMMRPNLSFCRVQEEIRKCEGTCLEAGQP